jgi:hypothetical protein
MRLSNSSMKTFWECPLKFQETYINGLQSPPSEALLFGDRFHERLCAHYEGLSARGVGYVPWKPKDLDPKIEADVLAMYEAYVAAYPVEPFEVLHCEQVFELSIPDSKHTYTGRFDVIIRDKATRKLQIMETKTEKAGSKRNLPKAWTARTQASLYTYAAQKVYGEQVDTVLLNVCTKASPKGQVGPSFRRDTLYRSPAQIAEAIKDLQYVANQIDALEGKEFPANRNNCTSDFGWDCEFWNLHNIGRSPEQLEQFVTIEPYSYLSM